MDKFPREIVKYICEFMTRNDARSLLATCRRFYTEIPLNREFKFEYSPDGQTISVFVQNHSEMEIYLAILTYIYYYRDIYADVFILGWRDKHATFYVGRGILTNHSVAAVPDLYCDKIYCNSLIEGESLRRLIEEIIRNMKSRYISKFEHKYVPTDAIVELGCKKYTVVKLIVLGV